MIAIVDYGLGNLGSLKNIFKYIGHQAEVVTNAQDLKKATHILLPGIGAFDTGMRHLKSSGMFDTLNDKVLNERTPVLGICLGAQLMTNGSEEGKEKGLGWLDADTKLMDFSSIQGKWPLPNIGWRDIYVENDYKLFENIEGQPRYYFVHSYQMVSNDPTIVAARSSYGVEFDCGLFKSHIHCVQFHPEKSHKFGKQFLKNFMEMT